MKYYNQIVIAGLLAAVGATAQAQCCREECRRSHNVFVELLGANDFVSVNYDTRFPGSPIFGWRAGISFSSIQRDKLFGSGGNSDALCPGISVPLGVNALLGRRASKFEVGVRVSPGLYFYQNKHHYHDFNSEWSEYYGPRRTLFGCCFGLDVGYRLQRRSGFFFRVGLSPALDVTKNFTSFHLLSIIPSLSFGYTFR